MTQTHCRKGHELTPDAFCSDEDAYIDGVLHKLCDAFDRGFMRKEGQWRVRGEDQHERVDRPLGEKGQMILNELEANPTASDRVVARKIGCTRSYVSVVKCKLRREGKFP